MDANETLIISSAVSKRATPGQVAGLGAAVSLGSPNQPDFSAMTPRSAYGMPSPTNLGFRSGGIVSI